MEDSIGNVERALECLKEANGLVLIMNKTSGWKGIKFEGSWRIEIRWDCVSLRFCLLRHNVSGSWEVSGPGDNLTFSTEREVVDYLFGWCCIG
jgi:hypothetical protein